MTVVLSFMSVAGLSALFVPPSSSYEMAYSFCDQALYTVVWPGPDANGGSNGLARSASVNQPSNWAPTIAGAMLGRGMCFVRAYVGPPGRRPLVSQVSRWAARSGRTTP